MDFSAPAILPPAASVTLLNAVTTATASTIQTRGTQYPHVHEALTLQVTGLNWRAAIVVEGRIGGGDWTALPLTGPLGLSLHQMTTIGIYYCNIAGVTSYRVRTTSFAGAGNVTVTGVTSMTFAPRTEQRRVNNRIHQTYQLSVAAGATTLAFTAVDVSGYPLIAFAMRGKDSEITGLWRAQILYAPVFNRDLGGSAANGMPEANITVLDTTAGRGQSDYIFNRAEAASVSIKNFDSVAHLFDVWILGIH